MQKTKQYDFETVINRKNTRSTKWDTLESNYHEKDLLPFWIADMDFKNAPEIIDGIKNYLDGGILGYTTETEKIYDAIINWQKTHFNYDVPREAILFNSSVVASLFIAVQAFSEVGDAVLINNPTYPPFAVAVNDNDRKLVTCNLQNKNGHYEIDFDEFEKDIVENNIKLYLLCNPNNPGGRVWTKDELNKIGEICKRHGVIVASDEIHEDIVFAPNVHTTFANAGENFADFSVTFTAVTKTFNLAGIKCSMIFAENEELRKKFDHVQAINCQHEINTFGLLGTRLAYENGEEWLVEVKDAIQTNINYIEEHLINETKITWLKPEGTYLCFLDFSAYGLSDEELMNKLVHEAKVVLNPGISFGPGGTGYMRFNAAAPLKLVKEGIERIKSVFN
jgi:cystathionine beta-lyase